MSQEFRSGDVVRLPDGRLATLAMNPHRGRVALSFSDSAECEGADTASLERIDPNERERALLDILRRVAERGDVRIDIESFSEERMMGLVLLGIIEGRNAE